MPIRVLSTIDLRLALSFLIGLSLAILLRLSPENQAIAEYWQQHAYAGGVFILRVLLISLGPAVFLVLVTTIASLGTLKGIKKVTFNLFLYYSLTTLVAILIGQTLVLILRPGESVPAELVNLGYSGKGQVHSGLKIITERIASLADGKLLAIIAVAIIVGFVMTLLPRKTIASAVFLLKQASRVYNRFVEAILQLVPISVVLLTLGTFLSVDVKYLSGLVQYVFVVVAGLVIQMTIVYPLILRFFVQYPVREFFNRARPAILSGFFSSSANVTIPVTSRVLQHNFGVSENIISLSVPLGATFNLDGTALFEVVSIVFIAQVFGVELSVVSHLFLILFVFVTSLGFPGVPGSSIAMMVTCLSLLNLPVEGMGLIIGLDAILMMVRASVNVTGDIVGALYVSRKEGAKLKVEAENSATLRKVA